jgi:RNA polymerase sigma-70 factor (ECF subfamily)
VAIAMADGFEAGLARLDSLADDELLAGYPTTTRRGPTCFAGSGARPRPAAAYQAALALTTNAVERAFLARRLAEVGEPRRTEPVRAREGLQRGGAREHRRGRPGPDLLRLRTRGREDRCAQNR